MNQGHAKLRIAVVGPITGGSWSIAAASVRALRKLGHHTTFVNNNHFAPALAQTKSLPPAERSQAEVAIFMHAAAETRRRVHEVQPQWALYLAQAPVLSENDLAPLRDRGAPSVFWFVEDFRVFTYWQRAAARFDHVWTIQRDPFPQLLAQAGVGSVDYVPLACEAARRRRAPQVRPTDIAFVGSGYPNRVVRLAALAGPNLRLFGPHFARDPRLAPFVAHDGVLSHNALAAVFATSGINLNLTSTLDPSKFGERKDFVNPRTFEICGAGGFQLAEDLIPFEEFFEPNAEVASFGSNEEARDKIAFFGRHEAARETIRRRGESRARAHHTYQTRLEAAVGRLLQRDGDRIGRSAEANPNRVINVG